MSYLARVTKSSSVLRLIVVPCSEVFVNFAGHLGSCGAKELKLKREKGFMNFLQALYLTCCSFCHSEPTELDNPDDLKKLVKKLMAGSIINQ